MRLIKYGRFKKLLYACERSRSAHRDDLLVTRFRKFVVTTLELNMNIVCSFRRIILVIFCCLLSMQVIAQQRGGSKAALVVVKDLQFEHATTSFEAIGTAEALRAVTLFPAVADRVTAINFAPEQRVESGDVLLELDNRKQLVAKQRAEIELADAERNLKRIEDSLNKGAVTQSAFDEAITRRDLAKVLLSEAKVDIEDRLVRAPFSGVVGLTDIEVGDRIAQNTPITTIDDRQQLFINFSAPESALNVINKKPIVTIQPWSDRELSLTAEIAQVDSRIDQQNRTIRARAQLNNFADEFRPGMSFRVNLTLLGERYAAIPEASLSWGAAGAYIWKVENDKAVKVPVEVKQRLRGRILVSGPLQEGEVLIAEGIQRLREGQAVESVAKTAQTKFSDMHGGRG